MTRRELDTGESGKEGLTSYADVLLRLRKGKPSLILPFTNSTGEPHNIELRERGDPRPYEQKLQAKTIPGAIVRISAVNSTPRESISDDIDDDTGIDPFARAVILIENDSGVIYCSKSQESPNIPQFPDDLWKNTNTSQELRRQGATAVVSFFEELLAGQPPKPANS